MQNRKLHVKPLEPSKAKVYLADLRDLLNREIPLAAEAIRTLTGPIEIRQEPIAGRSNGARWVATFSPDLLRLLRRVAKEKEIPELLALEYSELHQAPTVEVVLEKVPRYEQLAPKFKELHEQGVSISNIASAHGMCWEYAKEILEFAKTGVRPKWKSGKRTGKRTGKTGQTADYLRHSGEVARLRDDEKWSFARISKQLGIAKSTVRRAYDYAHRDDVADAVQNGNAPSRGRYNHLGEEVYREIRRRLRKGEEPKAIADQVGCGASTVYRERRKLQSEVGDAGC